MQKVKNSIKAFLLAVLSTVLVLGIAAMSACDGGGTSDGGDSNVSDGGTTGDNAGDSSDNNGGDSDDDSDENDGGDSSGENDGGDSDDDSDENDGDDSSDENADNNNDGDNPKEEESNLISGEYIVDVSWTGGMHNYMTLIVNIDAENDAFTQYYASDSSTGKGSGNITLSGGVYTMTYADISVDGVNATTFTFDGESGEITFTSALLWGTRSFDSSSTSADGSFVPYKAQPIVASGEYIVDLEWTGGMALYVTAIVNIDMSAMSFNLYYQSSPDTSKGTGKVIYSDGVYTMSYSEAVNEVSTATFTYDYTTKTITFISPLLWGSSSFDSSSTTDDGSFAPYTAAFVETSDDETANAVYENYTDYINTGSTTYAVSEGVVTYSIVTKANSPAGAFTITVAVGSDKTISGFTIETNGSTGGYESYMFDTSTLVGKTESELAALLSSDSGNTITTGATKSNTLCVYAALFAVGNYDICVENA